MAAFRDRFGALSSGYAKHRPTYPRELFQYLRAACAPDAALAVDVGCGTGQATASLAEHFGRVVGLDGSAGQIEEACRSAPPNVEYQVCTAEELGKHVAQGSADLITVAQAVHWFNLDAFYKAARLALRPEKGLIAVWTYQMPQFINNPALTQAMYDFYAHTHAQGWWDHGIREHIDTKYATLPFPFHEINHGKSWKAQATWKRADIDQFLRTWSCVRRAKDQFGVEDAVADAKDMFDRVWTGPAEEPIEWEIFVRLGRG